MKYYASLDEQAWDKLDRNPENNMAASIGSFQN